MLRKLAVLGSPIEHSKSPAIHTAAYRVLGLNWEYEKIEVRKGGLKPFVEALTPDWLGLSITMPLKEEAARFAESLNPAAELTEAVNTLVRTETGWAGYNTDVFGIAQALRLAGISKPASVLIIGSGATATSAVTAIGEMNSDAQILVYARNPKTRGELVSFAKSLGLKAKSARSIKSTGKKVALTIATLPGGALDEEAAKLARKNFVPAGALLDVAYSPWPSAFAGVWHSAHKPIISGLEMLLWQAISQIRIFQNGSPDQPLLNEVAVVEAMRHALD